MLFSPETNFHAIFFIFLYIVPIYSSNKCSMPNTEVLTNGKCSCIDGFTTDSELFQSLGCWKCANKCHPISKCEHPGICRCISGFVGDGISHCQTPIPILKKLSKRELLSNGETILTISFVDGDAINNSTNKFTPSHFYCQLGHTILKATYFNQTEVQCQIPKPLKGDLVLSISYDSYHWSNEELLVKFDNAGNTKEIIDAMPFLLTLLFSMLIGVVWFYGKSLFFQVPEAIEDNLIPIS